MEQILIRNLPPGTKAALKRHADQHHRSMEGEVRRILAEALQQQPETLVDLLADDEGADIEFTPQRLGIGKRTIDL